MKWFSNLKIKSKMLLSFTVIIAMMAGLAVIAGFQLQSVNRTHTNVTNHTQEGRAAVINFQSSFRDLRRIVATMSTYTGVDTAKTDSLYAEALVSYGTALGFIGDYETAISTNPQYSQADIDLRMGNASAVREVAEKYKTEFLEPMKELARQGDHNGSIELINASASISTELRDAVSNILSVSNEAVAKQTAAAEHSVSQTVTLLMIISIIIAVFSITVALYVSNAVSKPLTTLAAFMKKAGKTGDIALTEEDTKNINAMAESKDEIGETIGATAVFVRHIRHISEELSRIARGDLTVSVECLSDKDVMGMALTQMVTDLNNMFEHINVATEQVSEGATQVADGAQTLASGSTQQAATIQELSSALSEVSGKTAENSEMAGSAADLANTIKHNAEKGSKQMNEMVHAVNEISEASKNISKVIKVIDDIAFQTNILALNAAVEAARAGMAGKGFAVVAEEVRNLAAKSAEAAKDTSGLIANSMEKAELGSKIADETAASLNEIVNGINASSEIATKIATSSAEQTSHIIKINNSIDEVAKVVQQNSATSQQSAAVAEQMNGQSNILEGLITQFKLKNPDIQRTSRRTA